MVILLGCLAVAMCFTTLGMGFVNIARSASQAAGLAHKAQETKKTALTKPLEDPNAALKRREEALQKQIIVLQEKADKLAAEEQVQKASVDNNLQSVSAERNRSVRMKQELDTLERQNQQLASKLSEIQIRITGSSEEQRHQLQLRAQLEQQLAETRRQTAQAVQRIQELRASIEDQEKQSEY